MLEHKICCFTGHRPSSLPWRYEENGFAFLNFKKKLKKVILQTIKEGFNHFISGMALGVDILAAEIILDYKRKYKNIILECAIPCNNQSCKWKSDSIKRYEDILSKADIITMVSDKSYTNGCMQKRNAYMVDKSSRIIAVFNGKKGGTSQTIQLATKKRLEIFIIKP